MRTLAEVVVTVGRVDRIEVTRWIELGWVEPAQRAPEPAFSDLDVARIELICDLVRDLEVEEETVPLVLSLIDEIYALRRKLNRLTAAVQDQPEDVRHAIIDRMAAPRAGE